MPAPAPSRPKIHSPAHQLADARRGVVYGRIGTCNQEFGTLASWLVEVLNIVTGNSAPEGGSLFSPGDRHLRPRPVADGFTREP